jgi:transcriptional regulator with XRE-family HTH domain
MLQLQTALPVMECMNFMEKVRRETDRQHRKLAEVGRMTGIPAQRFTDWSDPDSNRNPTLQQALLIARALKVPLDYLADDELEEIGDSYKLSRDEEVLLTFIRTAKTEPRKALQAVMAIAIPKGLGASQIIVEAVAAAPIRQPSQTGKIVGRQEGDGPKRPKERRGRLEALKANAKAKAEAAKAKAEVVKAKAEVTKSRASDHDLHGKKERS